MNANQAEISKLKDQIEEAKAEYENYENFIENGQFSDYGTEKHFEAFMDEIVFAPECEPGTIKIAYGGDYLTYSVYRVLGAVDSVALSEFRAEWAQSQQEGLEAEIEKLQNEIADLLTENDN